MASYTIRGGPRSLAAMRLLRCCQRRGLQGHHRAGEACGRGRRSKRKCENGQERDAFLFDEHYTKEAG